jgi:serine/threonine protein phosphatase PrpC
MKSIANNPDGVQWRTLGIIATGKGHLTSGVPCQDYFTTASLRNGDLVTIVADGAGSAEFSGEGARVATEECLSLIAERASQKLLKKADYYEIFMTVAQRVADYARQFNLSHRDFYTTLNVLHCTQHRTHNASIGDSGCIILNHLDELQIMAKPTKGRYANETAFLTKRMVEKHFSYGERQHPISGYIAATDGIFDLLFEREKINSQSASALIDCLKRQEPTQAEKELKALLNSKTIERYTRDDLTLVLGVRPQDNSSCSA